MDSGNIRPDEPATGASAQEVLRIHRRAAIFGALGKGSAALAALSPLASHAVDVHSHKLPNAALPGGFGYCTISGFQSAAVSGAPNLVTCSAFAPSHFLTVESLTYTNGNLGINGTVNANKLRDALNTKYGVSVFSSSNVAPLLSATQPTPAYVAVAGSGVVLIWTSNNTSTALTRKNWPSASLDGLATFQSLFANSTDTRPLLRVLYDGLSANPATANCWFLSARLTVYNTTPTSLPAGFDPVYLSASYTGDAAALPSSDAYLFLKALCTVP